MAPKFINTVAAAVVALSAGLSLAAPVQAGQFSFNFSPRNAEEQQMLQLGLGVYALVEGIDSGSITQRGSNNSAGLTQGGGRNKGIIYQEGNRHNGTLDQQGGNNSYGLFQFGKNTDAHVTQRGGQSGLGFVFGW